MEKAVWTAVALSLCLWNASAPASAMDSNRSEAALTLDVSPIELWSVSQHWRIVTMTLSSVGVLLNVMALIIIVIHRQVTSSYRAMLFSLTAIDFGLILTTFLLAVTSIYEDTLVQTGDTKALKTISSVNSSTTITQPNPSVKTACLILTAMFHSFLISAATTTLATSVDRAVAVHSPVLYRVISTSKVKIAVEVSPSVLIVITGILTLPFLHQPNETLFCVPLVLADSTVLIFQACVLLLSAVGMTLTYSSIAYKLTRRAILVFPFFSQRTSDDTAHERYSTRLSVVHAAVQAIWFCFVYLLYAIYVIWLAVSGVDRVIEAQQVRFLLFSSLPLTNSLTNPLLVFFRLLKVRAFITRMRTELTHVHMAPNTDRPLREQRNITATHSSCVDRDHPSGTVGISEQGGAPATMHSALHLHVPAECDTTTTTAASKPGIDDHRPSTSDK